MAIAQWTFLFLLATAAAGGQTASALPLAERAFIGNGGASLGPGYQEGELGDEAERAYNEFFLSMKHWGRFEIVADPARADWIFEISLKNEQTCTEDQRRHSTQEHATNYHEIVLLMLDAKTMNVRNRFSETLTPPRLFLSRDKIFDRSIAGLIDDVKNEVGDHGGKTPFVAHDERPAPTPPRINVAQNISIHNRGAGDVSGEKYSGGGAQVYDQFAAELKRWGRYNLVPASEADLIFEISFSAPPQCDGIGDPQLQLFIVDARTGVALWGFTNHISHAILAGNARRNFTNGIARLVAEVRDVADRPTWPIHASIPAQAAPSVASASLVGAHVSNAAAIPVTISVPSDVVKSGSEVSITVTLKNATRQDLAFSYPEGDPLTCMTVVRDSSGNVGSTKEGSEAEQAHATWQGRPMAYSLHPEETQRRQCVVSGLHEMSHPGKYLIEVTQLDGRLVKSNTVTLTVVP